MQIHMCHPGMGHSQVFLKWGLSGNLIGQLINLIDQIYVEILLFYPRTKQIHSKYVKTTTN